MNKLLSIKNVSKKFKDTILFENVSFDIYEKGLYGLIGSSGSGKTTLLLMIGLIDEDYKVIYILKIKIIKRLIIKKNSFLITLVLFFKTQFYFQI